jgi:hypothetical protein
MRTIRESFHERQSCRRGVGRSRRWMLKHLGLSTQLLSLAKHRILQVRSFFSPNPTAMSSPPPAKSSAASAERPFINSCSSMHRTLSRLGAAGVGSSEACKVFDRWFHLSSDCGGEMSERKRCSGGGEGSWENVPEKKARGGRGNTSVDTSLSLLPLGGG